MKLKLGLISKLESLVSVLSQEEKEMEVILIFDNSGSMNQMGKIHLQRNLCRYVAQLSLIDQKKYSKLKFRFYQWTEKVSDFSVQKDGTIPIENPEGTSNFTALSDFVLGKLKKKRRTAIVIFSDGRFRNTDITEFQIQLKTITGAFIRTVAIGGDADLLKLRKISTNDSVYLSENISEAIDCVLFRTNECVVAPENLAQIQLSKPKKSDED